MAGTMKNTREAVAPPVGQELRRGDLVVGQKIRSRRKIRRISLERLAAEAGVSTGLLSQIERGLSSPSLQTLRRICAALEMPFTWLFGEDRLVEPHSDIVVRADDRRSLVFSDLGMTKELLTQDTDGEIQLVLMTLSPGGISGMAPFVHDGEMAGMIMKGCFDLIFEDRTLSLGKDDSFRFKGNSPHSWRNTGKEEGVVLIAVTPPFY